MRNATYHSPKSRPTRPAPRYCATCGARAFYFTSAPICGPCFDKVIAAADAARLGQK